MSTTYICFLEGRINGEWVCLNPYYQEQKKGKKKYFLTPLYETNSRSCFEKTYFELVELSSYQEDKSNISYGISKQIKSWLLDSMSLSDEINETLRNMCLINFRNIENKVLDKTKFDRTAIVHKDAITRMSDGNFEEFDEDEIISLKKYNMLSSKLQSLYEVYSWDDPYNWRKYFKILVKKAKYCIKEYCDAFYLDEIHEVRVVMFIF